MFSHWPGSDSTAGVLLLVISLAALTACLLLIVKILGSMLRGAVAKAVQVVEVIIDVKMFISMSCNCLLKFSGVYYRSVIFGF